MLEDDPPLLSTPSLMALILRRTAEGPVTPDGLNDALDALFAAAQEHPALPEGERRALLARHVGDLEIAGLVAAADGGAYRLTERGEDALIRHPEGVDGSDLVRYPEYAAHIRANGTRAAGMDRRAGSYDEGYAARRGGESFTANPYTANTVDHLSWENGWMQALDDERG